MTPPSIHQINKTLNSGGVIIFPTDTVWGIGASLSSPRGIAKLCQVKRRPFNQPTAILVSGYHMAKNYGKINPSALNLINHHWPGALTLIVKIKSTDLPQEVVGVGETIALRAPKHRLVQQIITHHSHPIVASSANFANEPPPSTQDQINPNLLNLIDLLIPGNSSPQPSSTIVDTTTDPPTIVRQGSTQIFFPKSTTQPF